MSNKGSIFVGDGGFVIGLISGIDLTNATDLRAVITHQDDDAIEIVIDMSAGDVVDNASGEVNVPISAGDITKSGTHIIQFAARKVGAPEWDLASETPTFYVGERNKSNFWE